MSCFCVLHQQKDLSVSFTHQTSTRLRSSALMSTRKPEMTSGADVSWRLTIPLKFYTLYKSKNQATRQHQVLSLCDMSSQNRLMSQRLT